jgi:tRNA uridine 5-carboxymethylaminomethyl modification enzyme
MAERLSRIENLTRVAGIAQRVRLDAGRVAGVELADGRFLAARAVVITPGTFLNGLMHIGERKIEGGRIGEHAARALSECLADLGLERGRLKTGTPPRLHRSSIDWSEMEPQAGDDPPQPFSHWAEALVENRIHCHLTATNPRTHDAIRRNLDRSPLYSGEIRGTGPRYCPSIEDKVVKFAGRDSHHIFIEPEGLDAPEIYVNGLSSSLPEEVQLEAVRTIRGLERAEMIRPGYAVEYDYVLPHQLDSALAVRSTPGLYLAGQICGTSGYEEAAAQGLIAGINAARALCGHEPFVLRRDQAYIGVLIDDLVTREHREPYRMFTSAAEHRLLLRADNADERLAPLGQELGLIDRGRLASVRLKYEAIEREERRRPAPDPKSEDDATRAWPADWRDALEVRARYRGYIERQQRTALRAQALESVTLSGTLWDGALTGVSSEAREKLKRWRPATAAQAGRIAGVSPADVAVLCVLARRARARPHEMPTA